MTGAHDRRPIVKVPMMDVGSLAEKLRRRADEHEATKGDAPHKDIAK